jgi:hypothetical protein
MEELLQEARPDATALQNLVADTLLQRENDKLDKRVILNSAMAQYAKYGKVSPFSDKLSKERLLALQTDELHTLLQQLQSVEHEILYHGPRMAEDVAGVLKKYHPAAQSTVSLGCVQEQFPPKQYPEQDIHTNRVYFVHFPMVQVEMMLMSKGTSQFDLSEFALSEWYNQYFGYGLSSIVFQEIRESKALAYSAYAYAGSPNRKDRAHYLRTYVGTQPDKLREAVSAFQDILEKMPVSLPQMENARQGVLRQLAAERLIKADIYWSWRGSRDRGFDNRDLRADVYNTLQKAGPEVLLHYHNQTIKGRSYIWLVLGDRERLDFDYLKTIGPVQELTLEEIFGY